LGVGLCETAALDFNRTLAAKFAVMHNTAQTGMIRSVELEQADETAAPVHAPNELNK
jgi:hypothetical protein